jgi:hypothetical protein
MFIILSRLAPIFFDFERIPRLALDANNIESPPIKSDLMDRAITDISFVIDNYEKMMQVQGQTV